MSRLSGQTIVVSLGVNYRIERLSTVNIESLVRLYKTCFNKVVTVKFLREKYDTRAFGVEHVGFLAFTEDGNLGAYYGVIPCHLQVQGNKVLSAQSADTMTHPDHRNKGLFKLLAQKTYELAAQSGIRMVFGFPNQNSLPGFRKLGWAFAAAPLQLFTVASGGKPYAKLLRRIPFSHALYSLIFNLRLSKLTKTFFNEQQTGMLHDEDFVRYKTYNKNFIAVIDGVMVWANADGHFRVGAINGVEHIEVQKFLKNLKAFARRLGCDEIIFMTTANTPLFKMLSLEISARPSFPIGYLYLGPPPPLDLDNASFEFCDIDIF